MPVPSVNHEANFRSLLAKAEHDHGARHPKTVEAWIALIRFFESKSRSIEADWEFENLARMLKAWLGERGWRSYRGMPELLRLRDRLRKAQTDLEDFELDRSSSRRAGKNTSTGITPGRPHESSPTSEPDNAETAKSPDADVVEKVELFWRSDGNEHVALKLQLSRQAVAEGVLDPDVRKLSFEIDGRDVGVRWTRSRGESEWSGHLRIESEVRSDRGETYPNLSPGTLRVYGRGRDVAWVDPILPELREDIAVYDVKKEEFQGRDKVMDPEREYILRIPTAYGIDVGEWGETRGVGPWKLVRLRRGWPGDIEIRKGDEILWRPHLTQRTKADAPPSLRLVAGEGMQCKLGGKAILKLEGVPEGIEALTLLLGQKEIQLHEGPDWITREEVLIDVDLARRTIPIRARIGGRWKNWRLPVVNAVRPIGMLSVRCRFDGRTEATRDEWRIQPESDEVDIFGRAPQSVGRVFAGGDSDQAFVWEGRRRVRPGHTGEISPRELRGLGEQLRMDLRSDKGPFRIASEVVDRGIFRMAPIMYGPWVELREQSELGEGFEWCILLGPPNGPLDLERIACQAAPDRTAHWRLPGLPAEIDRILAVGLAFKGVRRGAWWNMKPIGKRIDQSLNDPKALRMLLAHLRWFHAPVLLRDLRGPMQAAANRHPVDFIRGWLHLKGLDDGLKIEAAAAEREGADAVAREFLWSLSPERDILPADMVEAILGFEGHAMDARAWKRVGEVCPLLMARLMIAMQGELRPDTAHRDRYAGKAKARPSADPRGLNSVASYDSGTIGIKVRVFAPGGFRKVQSIRARPTGDPFRPESVNPDARDFGASIEMVRELRDWLLPQDDSFGSGPERRLSVMRSRVASHLGWEPEFVSEKARRCAEEPKVDSEATRTIAETSEGRRLLCIAVLDRLFPIRQR